MATENPALKKMMQAHLLEHHLDLEPIGPRSHRDAALAMIVQMFQGFVHALDGGNAFLQAHISPFKKLLQPVVGQGSARHGFDGHPLAFDRMPHKALHAFGQ